MAVLLLSFIAGILTVAAPCILPLLPVIVGGSLAPPKEGQDSRKLWLHPLIISASLAVSVISFTLLLKATTALLGIPIMVWQIFSGLIVLLLGLTFVIPAIWEKLSLKIGLALGSNKLLAGSSHHQGFSRDILIGASLGPVFNSCSPTYALIVATALPASFVSGLSYLVAYALGLSLMLLLVAYLGQSFINKLGWLSNPHGKFRLVIGVLFLIVGLGVLFGLDKKLQTFVLEQGWYNPVSKLEHKLM